MTEKKILEIRTVLRNPTYFCTHSINTNKTIQNNSSVYFTMFKTVRRILDKKTIVSSDFFSRNYKRMLSPIISHQAVYNNPSKSQISDKSLGYPYTIPPPAPFFGGLGNQTTCGRGSSSLNNVTSMKAIRVHR